MSLSKPCIKCSAIKPLDAYYRHSMMRDGHLNKCIDCVKADMRTSRTARIEYYKAYDRQRAKDPKRVAARVAYNQKNPRPRPELDPQKKAARTALSNAIRDGKIIKPPECQICAVSDDVHGHHEDYSLPLDVIWVCTGCHALIHAYWRAQDRLAG